jgi:hypothetical protein
LIPTARTITFTDGRIVQLQPGSRIYVDGREVTFSQLRPGAVVALAPSGGVPSTAVPSPSVRPHPPVDVNGTVASVDRQTGVITFQDGRMVRATEGRVWQRVGINGIQPGADVLVGSALPVGYGPGAPAANWSEYHRMGRVNWVDPSGTQVVLNDGTTVAVGPSTQMQVAGGRAVTITDLRPGDQVVIRARPSAPVAGAPVDASFAAEQIIIVRR